MNNQLVWSSAAENDFVSVLSYLTSKWNRNVAENFEQLVDHNIKLILHDPLQFAYYSRSFQISKCILTKHNTLYYNYDSGIVYLLRIYDTRQNPHKLKF